MYNKSAELRAMFIDTLTKVTQGYISHTPLRMIQVKLFKFCGYLSASLMVNGY